MRKIRYPQKSHFFPDFTTNMAKKKITIFQFIKILLFIISDNYVLYAYDKFYRSSFFRKKRLSTFSGEKVQI